MYKYGMCAYGQLLMDWWCVNCEYVQHSTYRMLIKGKVARTSKLMWKECGRAI